MRFQNTLVHDHDVTFYNYGVSRPGKLSPYRQEVKRLRSQNVTYQAIYEIIKEKRLEEDFQTSSTKEMEAIEKKWLIKWMYKPLEEVSASAITSEPFDTVSKEYPIFRGMYDLLREFKVLMFSNKVEELEPWMKKAQSYV